MVHFYIVTVCLLMVENIKKDGFVGLYNMCRLSMGDERERERFKNKPCLRVRMGE